MQVSPNAIHGRVPARPYEIEHSDGHPRLYVREGNECREASPDEVIQCTQRLIEARFRRKSPLPSQEQLFELLRLQLAPRDRMIFAALFLDSRGRVIELVELFHGSITHVRIHIREIFREALQRNAAMAIFARSDPSGCAEPTENDELQCAFLREAMAHIEIRVLDYLIVADEVISLAERASITPTQQPASAPSPASPLPAPP